MIDIKVNFVICCIVLLFQLLVNHKNDAVVTTFGNLPIRSKDSMEHIINQSIRTNSIYPDYEKNDIENDINDDDQQRNPNHGKLSQSLSKNIVKDDNIYKEWQKYRHNKMLKPNKNEMFVTTKDTLRKDACGVQKIPYRVKEKGCLARSILINFCYGQCNSFFIPIAYKRQKNRNGYLENTVEYFSEPETIIYSESFRSCGFCKPDKYTWVTVTLRCPSNPPVIRRKRIQKIQECRCQAANV